MALDVSGANYRLLRLRIRKLGLDTAHWLGQAHSRGTKRPHARRQSLQELLCENSSYTNLTVLKRRLLDAGVLAYGCSVCQNTGTWLGQALTLHLDHANGVADDHRVENLRLLCPNCHSQTATYAGRNKGKRRPA